MSTIVSFYNLSDLTLTPSITCDQPLDSEYWVSDDSPIPPTLTQTRPLVMNRDKGITDGDTYSFTLAFPIGAATAGLVVKLLGSNLAPGSYMTQSIFYGTDNVVTWSSNDSQTITWPNGDAYYSLTATLVRRIGASFYDIILTLSTNAMDTGAVYPVGTQWFSPSALVGMTLTESGLVMTRTMFNERLWAPAMNPGTVASTAVYNNGTLTVFDASNNEQYSLVLTDSASTRAVLAQTPDLVPWFNSYTMPGGLSLPPIDWGAYVYVYGDSNGYQYSETSEYWKMMCQVLPCSIVLQWPGYATATVNVTLKGKPAVIQVWRGHCQRFLGDSSFPGGYGAEVGVYVPGDAGENEAAWRLRAAEDPTMSLILLSSSITWLPAPQLVDTVAFTMINPITGGTFISSQPEPTYWNCKWMEPDSYTQYCADQNGMVPSSPDQYVLEFTVNGQSFIWNLDGTITAT